MTFPGILKVQYFERIEMIFCIKYCNNEQVTLCQPLPKLEFHP